ncbi:PITH domain-containing protein [Podospora fimiseda]|uniref:PITH domain-containing protein n=1 Tax=Podospora fimiseda TaxID=252190 RepID=A0AAN7BTF8_9PEZI|nr:PITH domain-containing protein [Podospora fimiseda]
MSKTVNITSASQFDGLLKSSKLVVVDFYADWCGPCKQIAPIFEKLSGAISRENVVTFAKVNTENQKDIAQAYNVQGLPTFIVFRDGKVADRVTGANPLKLQAIVKKLSEQVSSLQNSGGESSGGDGAVWRGAALPRGYTDITQHIEVNRTELLNVDNQTGGVRVLFESSKPSALSKSTTTKKDWVESDTDEQLMLFLPFQAMLKLHTIQLTSLPPTDDDDDEAPTRPRTIKLFINKTHNLDFDEAEDMAATQQIELSGKDWNAEGTASIPLRYVKFQNINSLVLFVVDGESDSEKTRLDRIRLIGEAGEKREMGKLEKIGDEAGE